MEISDVKKGVLAAIDRARRAAAARRTRVDEAAREYDTFLEHVAGPLFRQVVNVLRAEGYLFSVFTPGGSVRLMSDRAAEDYIELVLELVDDVPQVVGRTSRRRGRRIVETERPVKERTLVRDLTDDDVLAFVMTELEPFVER